MSHYSGCNELIFSVNACGFNNLLYQMNNNEDIKNNYWRAVVAWPGFVFVGLSVRVGLCVNVSMGVYQCVPVSFSCARVFCVHLCISLYVCVR